MTSVKHHTECSTFLCQIHPSGTSCIFHNFADRSLDFSPCSVGIVINGVSKWPPQPPAPKQKRRMRNFSGMLSKQMIHLCIIDGTITPLSGQINVDVTQYKVFHQLRDLGWVDFDSGSSAICPILLRQMGFLQKQLSIWARWWKIPILSQANTSLRVNDTPCTF